MSSTCSRRLGGGWAVGIGVGRDLLSLPEPAESGLVQGSQRLGRGPSVEPEKERLLVRAHHFLVLGRSLEELTPPPGTALPVWMLHAAASYPGTLCQGLSLGWGPLRAAAPSPKRPGGCERQGLLSWHQRAHGAGALMGFPWQAWARPPGLPLIVGHPGIRVLELWLSLPHPWALAWLGTVQALPSARETCTQGLSAMGQVGTCAAGHQVDTVCPETVVIQGPQGTVIWPFCDCNFF